jgi:hypothetical protein
MTRPGVMIFRIPHSEGPWGFILYSPEQPMANGSIERII